MGTTPYKFGPITLPLGGSGKHRQNLCSVRFIVTCQMWLNLVFLCMWLVVPFLIFCLLTQFCFPLHHDNMISFIFCRIRLLFEYDEDHPEDLPPFQFKTFIERKEMMVSFKAQFKSWVYNNAPCLQLRN